MFSTIISQLSKNIPLSLNVFTWFIIILILLFIIISQLSPLLTNRPSLRRLKISSFLTILFSSSFILIISYQLISTNSLLFKTENKIVSYLKTNSNNGKTFKQVKEEINLSDDLIVFKSINNLIDRGCLMKDEVSLNKNTDSNLIFKIDIYSIKLNTKCKV